MRFVSEVLDDAESVADTFEVIRRGYNGLTVTSNAKPVTLASTGNVHHQSRGFVRHGMTIGTMHFMIKLTGYKICSLATFMTENPPLLQFFLTHILFGYYVHKMYGIHKEEVVAASQFQIDRQLKHQTKKNYGF